MTQFITKPQIKAWSLQLNQMDNSISKQQNEHKLHSLLWYHSDIPIQNRNDVLDLLKEDSHFYNLYSNQKNCKLNPNFLDKKIINSKMRTKLVKWMISLCHDLGFKPETYFLSVTILDKYLSVSNQNFKVLQLIGATCINISSKVCQSKIFSSESYRYSCSNVFTVQALIEKEKEILLTLGFNISFSNPLKFLKIIKAHLGLDEIIYKKCEQILTFTLQNQKYYQYSHMELVELIVLFIQHRINYNIQTISHQQLLAQFSKYYSVLQK